MAAQVSLPSIGYPRRQSSSYHARLHSGCRRQFLRDDRVEEARIGQAIYRRRVFHRGFCKFLIAALIKRLRGGGGVLRPFRKLLWWHDVNVEMHVGKSVAAEMCGEAMERPRFVRPQVEPGG